MSEAWNNGFVEWMSEWLQTALCVFRFCIDSLSISPTSSHSLASSHHPSTVILTAFISSLSPSTHTHTHLTQCLPFPYKHVEVSLVTDVYIQTFKHFSFSHQPETLTLKSPTHSFHYHTVCSPLCSPAWMFCENYYDLYSGLRFYSFQSVPSYRCSIHTGIPAAVDDWPLLATHGWVPESISSH